MVHSDPSEHDELYVKVWGDEYRKNPGFTKWLEDVRANKSRTLSAYKNDLRDRHDIPQRKNPLTW